MSENVVYLHPQPEPVAHYLRLGAFHRQVEKLLAAGRLPVARVVVEASAFTHQKDVVRQLVDAGREMTLDTNVAELSAVGRYGGAAKSAPWAHSEGPLQPEHFARGSRHDVIGKIARFAVEHGFHAVQAPAHLLEGSTDAWFGIDRQACKDLRRALDVAGGATIAIDYPLTLKYGSLRDPAQRRVLIAGLSDLPFENLWLRVSGFGADAEAPMLRRDIAAAADFQQLDGRLWPTEWAVWPPSQSPPSARPAGSVTALKRRSGSPPVIGISLRSPTPAAAGGRGVCWSRDSIAC
jgi:hypothetical protein